VFWNAGVSANPLVAIHFLDILWKNDRYKHSLSINRPSRLIVEDINLVPKIDGLAAMPTFEHNLVTTAAPENRIPAPHQP
jgi:hypothetical protein